jgi:hypothetical protein
VILKLNPMAFPYPLALAPRKKGTLMKRSLNASRGAKIEGGERIFP